MLWLKNYLADVSDIFYFFFCLGGSEREEEFEAKSGRTFYLEIEKGGRVSEEGRRSGHHRGWEGAAWRGGGGIIFNFFGAEVSTKIIDVRWKWGRTKYRRIPESKGD